MSLRRLFAALVLCLACGSPWAATLVSRQDTVQLLNAATGFLKPAPAYTVVVYRMGAFASGPNVSLTIPVYAGHALKVGDKLGIWRPSTSAWSYSGTFTVLTVASTSITMNGGSYFVQAGDMLVPLGADAGVSSANFTASDLRIYPAASTGSTAITQSRVTTNNGGEYGFFSLARAWWEVILRSGTTVVSVKPWRASPEVTPFEWGAKGDGSTNDSTALQGWLNTTGRLFIPAATFMHASTLTVASSTTITGEGDSSVVKTSASSDVDGFAVDTSATDVRFASFKIDGNRANQVATTLGRNIKANNGATRLVIEDMTLTNSMDNAINFHGGDTHPTGFVVRGCRIITPGENGVMVSKSAGAIITGNSFIQWGQVAASSNAISIQDYAQNILVSGNHMLVGATTLFAIESSGIPQAIDGATITDNTIDGNALSGGISVWSNFSTISGNTIINGIGTTRSSLELSGRYLTVSNNSIEGGSIFLYGPTSGISGPATITGNSIVGTVNNARAILLASSGTEVRDTVVSGNTIDLSGATGSVGGIFIGDGGSVGKITRVSVLGNRMFGPTALGAGINLNCAAASSGVVISGNAATGFTDGFDNAANSNVDEVTIANNDFRGNSNPIVNSSTGGTYRIYGNITANDWTGGVGTNVGDASLLTITHGTSEPTQLWSTTLTANRVARVLNTNAQRGATFRIVRSGLGGFTLDVQRADATSLKIIPINTAATADVTFDGTNWILTNYAEKTPGATAVTTNQSVYAGTTNASFDSGNEVCAAHGLTCDSTFTLSITPSIPACSATQTTPFLAMCH